MLGGGGARGAAHLGIYTDLHKYSGSLGEDYIVFFVFSKIVNSIRQDIKYKSFSYFLKSCTFLNTLSNI